MHSDGVASRIGNRNFWREGRRHVGWSLLLFAAQLIHLLRQPILDFDHRFADASLGKFHFPDLKIGQFLEGIKRLAR